MADLFRTAISHLFEHFEFPAAISALIVCIEDQLNVDKDNAQLWADLGFLLVISHQYERSLVWINKVLEQNPHDELALLNKSTALHKLYRFEEALKLCAEAPPTPNLLIMQAISYDGCYKNKECADSCLEVLKSEPENCGALLYLGFAELSLNRFDEADQRFKEVVDITNNLVFDQQEALTQLQRHLVWSDRLPPIEPALRAYLKHSWDWNYRGLAHRDLNNNKEAVTAFLNATALNPLLDQSYSNMGIAYFNLTRVSDSLASMDKAIEINPHTANAWNNKGIILSNIGRHEDAIHALDTSIRLYSGQANAHLNKARLCIEMNAPADAIALLERALEIDPQFCIAWCCLGDVKGMLGQIEAAKSCYKKAIELYPYFAEARVSLGILYQQDVMPMEQVVSVMETALDLSQSRIEAECCISIEYFNSGQYPISQEWVDHALFMSNQTHTIAQRIKYALSSLLCK